MKTIQVIVTTAMFSLQVFGQQGQQPKPADEGARPEARKGGPFAGGGMRGGPGIERVFSVLTEEQRASMRDAMDGQFEKVRDLEEKLRDARRALFEAALAEKFDEAAVREKAEAAAKLETEITVIRAKAFSKVKPPLSAEQLQTLRQPPTPGGREGESEPRRRQRPETPRDENGLPLKKRTTGSETGSETQARPEK